MVKLEDFTEKSSDLIAEAVKLANVKSHPSPEVEHLLYCIFKDESNTIVNMVRSEGVDPRVLSDKTEEYLAKLPVVDNSNSPKEGEVTVGNRLLDILVDSKKRAEEEEHAFVPLTCLFLSICEELGQRFIHECLSDAGIDLANFKNKLNNFSSSSKVKERSSTRKKRLLAKLAVDMIQKAKGGGYAPVVGRDKELRRVIQTLCRKSKNNPVLIGHPGVGKTAIVEELSKRIAAGDVPEALKSASLYMLDVGALMAGTKHRGDLEERVNSLIKEVEESPSKVVLFIDEIHLVTNSSSSDASIGNLLKPALSRGEFRCIGATTLDEFRKGIETDPALERRFQQIMVVPPTTRECIGILRGIRETYESFHGLQVKDEALVSAVELSERYIPDKFLPDKSIDLLDEACARVVANNSMLPEPIESIKANVLELEIELRSLEREPLEYSEKIKEVKADLSNLKESLASLQSQLDAEKSALERFKKCKAEMLKIEAKILDAESGGENLDFYYRYKTIDKPRALASLKSAERGLQLIDQDSRLTKDVITSHEIAQVVHAWTGVPVSQLSKTDREKLSSLYSDMTKKVINQEESCESICDAVIRSRSGVSDPTKPVGTFLMLGPTGVGKTETAKVLAELLFDDREKVVRIDMSEYGEKHSVSRLVGAPPGYIGFENAGQLTEQIRRNPYSVVLFDEMEKAHPDVFDIFLQILDEGRLTDGQGRTVNFKNTVIMMTSNFGSSQIMRMTESNTEKQKIKDEILSLLKGKFRPEFLNRIDEILFYNPLEHANLVKIADIKLAQLSGKLKANGIELHVNEGVSSFIVQQNSDITMGARPIQRFLQKNVENMIAKKIIECDEKIEKISLSIKEGIIVLE